MRYVYLFRGGPPFSHHFKLILGEENQNPDIEGDTLLDEINKHNLTTVTLSAIAYTEDKHSLSEFYADIMDCHGWVNIGKKNALNRMKKMGLIMVKK